MESIQIIQVVMIWSITVYEKTAKTVITLILHNKMVEKGHVHAHMHKHTPEIQ